MFDSSCSIVLQIHALDIHSSLTALHIYVCTSSIERSITQYSLHPSSCKLLCLFRIYRMDIYIYIDDWLMEQYRSANAYIQDARQGKATKTLSNTVFVCINTQMGRPRQTTVMRRYMCHDYIDTVKWIANLNWPQTKRLTSITTPILDAYIVLLCGLPINILEQSYFQYNVCDDVCLQ